MRQIIKSVAVFLIICSYGCKQQVILPDCEPGDASSINTPATTNSPETIVLEPATIRDQLFHGNKSVLLAVNRVHKAKDEVNIARARLLPSINLGAILATGSTPGFFLSSVEFLLPFLVPSKWFDYYAVKDLLKAELVALRLMKLNTYASTYSLYYSLLTDSSLYEILNSEANDLSAIETNVEHSYQLGLATEEDLNRARGQASLAKINLSKVSDLISIDRASMRHALGLSTETQISWTAAEVAKSDWEGRHIKEALEHAVVISPEAEQLHHLQSAAKKYSWSKLFGFLSGLTDRTNRKDVKSFYDLNVVTLF